MTSPAPVHHVVIIGGGFGGLRTAQGLANLPGVHVTLVDRRNFHLFQPLLYQVATGALSPANIATPLRSLVARQRNTEVLFGEMTGIDLGARRVQLRDGVLPFDTVVVAAGSHHHYFGHPEWEVHAPGLKTVEDATRMRSKILSALEAAERSVDPAQRTRLMTWVVVGGGPTAIELAGALAEITRHAVRGEFRRLNPTDIRILVVEAAARVLGSFPEALSATAMESLRSLGIEVRISTRVTSVHADHVELTGATGVERVECSTVLWCAGVRGSPVGALLAAATGTIIDHTGRVPVEQDCSILGHPQILVIGDLALHRDGDGTPLPGLAPVAMQQGDYVARLIRARLAGSVSPPFRYHDRGSMAVIGKNLAIARIGTLSLSGALAWWAWLVIHLMSLVAFESRVLVLIQWAWYYWTWNRGARLITHHSFQSPMTEALVTTPTVSMDVAPPVPPSAQD